MSCFKPKPLGKDDEAGGTFAENLLFETSTFLQQWGTYLALAVTIIIVLTQNKN